MTQRLGPMLLFAQFLGDLALTLLAVKLAEQLRLHLVTGFERREQFVAISPKVYLLVLGVWAMLFLLFGAFDIRRQTLLADIGRLWLSITVSILVVASIFYFIAVQPPAAPSRLFYVYFFVLDVVFLTMAHIVTFETLAALRRRGRHLRRVLIVGGGVRGRHLAIRLRGQQRAGLILLGYLSEPDDEPISELARLGSLEDIREVAAAHAVQEVVMGLPAEDHAKALALTAELDDLDVNIRILPDVFEMVAMKARAEDFYGLPLISVREPSINPVQARVKRAFDVVMGTLLLVLAAPVMLLIALFVRLSSQGPILVHQRRVGAGGKIFYMHKFRSMRWDPDDLNALHIKQPEDPRVTSVGRILRRTSLDELPQLWNVFVGEMSLVGPRPELPAIVDHYQDWQLKRFGVPPGMTGWWQVNGRSERSMQLNTEIDLFYVQNYSILLDVQILLRTVGAVIRGRGAF